MIFSIVAIFAGLVLLSGSLRSVPAVGAPLERFARWLSVFDVAIGVVAIVVGIISLLSLEGILMIMAGLVLAASALQSMPPLAKLGMSLVPFRLLIGVVILIVGLFGILMPILGSLK
jgi:hypothetical protein